MHIDGMDVIVECHAGYKGEQEPRMIRMDGRCIPVASILDAWLAPDHRYFKVLGEDGAEYILRHDTQSHRWELVMYKR